MPFCCTVLLTLNDFPATASEWISLVATFARTSWNVIDDSALSVDTAHAWTWIAAMLSNASGITGTISIVDALGATAVRVGITNVRWYTGAFSDTVAHTALGILTARRRIAWIRWHDCCIWYSGTSNKSITLEAFHAITVGRMVDYMALGVGAACSSAWILAFLANTCLILWTFIAEHALGTTIWRAADVVGNA